MMQDDIPPWPGCVVWMRVSYAPEVLTATDLLHIMGECSIDESTPDPRMDGLVVGEVYRREDYERIVRAVREVQEHRGVESVRLVVEIDGEDERCRHIRSSHARTARR